MRGLFVANSRDSLDLDSRWENSMSEVYRRRSLTVNFCFFLLILVSFIFLNSIFAKHITNLYEEQRTNAAILENHFRNSDLIFHTQGNLFNDANNFSSLYAYEEKLKECKVILFALNLLFLCIVLYTIGSFVVSVNSIKKLEGEFVSQLERNKELKNLFKEKSRCIRRKFKQKIRDLKSKRNTLIDSVRELFDDHSDRGNNVFQYDEHVSLKTNFLMNEIGILSWDIDKDIVSIDRVCFKLLNLKDKAFVGNYTLFLNLFDKESRRELKKDITYALKFNTNFSTNCSLKSSHRKGLLLKGSLICDRKNKTRSIKGVLMKAESVEKRNLLESQFLSQPIGMFAILDKDFRFEFVNQSWLNYTGHSIHELKGYPIFNFIHQREKRMLINNLNVLWQDNDTSIRNRRYLFRQSDGGYSSINFTISYENNRFYIIANPIKHKMLNAKRNLERGLEFNFQKGLEAEYLRS